MIKSKILLLTLITLFFSCSSSDDNSEETLQNEAQSFAYNSTKGKLVEINLLTGNEINITSFIEIFDGHYVPSYLPNTNEVIGIDRNYNFDLNQEENRIVKFNIISGTISTLNLLEQNEYAELVIGNNHKVYAYNKTKMKLVEININDGTEIDISPVYNIFDGHFVPSFNSSTNEIIGVESEYNKIIKFNLNSQTVTSLNLIPNNNYSELVFAHNKGYAYNGTKNKLVEIDLTTGNEIDISESFEIFDNSFNPRFNQNTNEIIGIEHEFDRIVKFNIQSGNVSTLNLIENNTYGEITIK